MSSTNNSFMKNIDLFKNNISANPDFKKLIIFLSVFLFIFILIIVFCKVYLPKMSDIAQSISLFFLITGTISATLFMFIKLYDMENKGNLSFSFITYSFVSLFAIALIGFSIYLSKEYVFPKINGIVFALYLFFMIFIYISVFIIIAVKGVEVKSNNKYPLIKYFKNWFLILLAGFGIIALIFGIIFLFAFFSSHLLILKIIILIVAILILVALFQKFVILQKINNLFINLLLYIPCLINSNLAIVFGDKTYLFLILLEIILILLYLFYPVIQSKLYTKNAVQLINKPVKLYQYNSLGTTQSLNNSDDPNYNYAISFWVYLDSVQPSVNNSYTKEGNILSLGKTPSVRYKSTSNEIIISAESNDQDIQKDRVIGRIKDVKLQKWNNIIINYSGGTMDIFCNAKLISSSPEVVPYQSFEVLEVGQDNGTSGGLANLLYYRNSLDIYSIRYLYNSFKNTNPPSLPHPNQTIIPQ